MSNTNPATLPDSLIGADRVMDVREIPCSIKHGLILRNCAELAVKDHFILLNGRDPAHLRDEIASFWPDAFSWEYVVRRSDEVRVKITKLKLVKASFEIPTDHNCSH